MQKSNKWSPIHLEEKKRGNYRELWCCFGGEKKKKRSSFPFGKKEKGVSFNQLFLRKGLIRAAQGVPLGPHVRKESSAEENGARTLRRKKKGGEEGAHSLP